jgi:hypothetical protein
MSQSIVLRLHLNTKPMLLLPLSLIIEDFVQEALLAEDCDDFQETSKRKNHTDMSEYKVQA